MRTSRVGSFCARARSLSPPGRGICLPLDRFRNKRSSCMPTFSVSKGAAKAAKSDVLVVPVFEGLKLGPGAKDAQDALGSTVKELSEHVPVLGKPSKQFKGELGDAILVQTLGKLPAKQVLFVGMGPEKEATAGTVRRAGAIAARRLGGGK